MSTYAMERRTMKQVIAKMLSENTGRHMLDSGGAYGRHWERNQGRNFEAERPVARIHRWEDYQGNAHEELEIGVPAFYFLTTRPMSYNAKMTNAMHRWGNKRADLSYFAEWQEWLDSLTIKDWDGRRAIEWREEATVNTYNGEDLLDQTIQYTIVRSSDLAEKFGAGSDEFVFLQTHNGCDVRGGYSRCRIFEANGEYAGLYENARGTLVCANGHHYYDTDDAGYSWHYKGERCWPKPEDATLFDVSKFDGPFDDGLVTKGWSGHFKELLGEEGGKPLCPICGRVMEFYINEG